MELQRAKENFACNPGKNILELYDVLVKVQFTTSKANDIYFSKLGIYAATRFAERFKFRISGNKEISELSQIWMEPSV